MGVNVAERVYKHTEGPDKGLYKPISPTLILLLETTDLLSESQKLRELATRSNIIDFERIEKIQVELTHIAELVIEEQPILYVVILDLIVENLTNAQAIISEFMGTELPLYNLELEPSPWVELKTAAEKILKECREINSNDMGQNSLVVGSFLERISAIRCAFLVNPLVFESKKAVEIDALLEEVTGVLQEKGASAYYQLYFSTQDPLAQTFAGDKPKNS